MLASLRGCIYSTCICIGQKRGRTGVLNLIATSKKMCEMVANKKKTTPESRKAERQFIQMRISLRIENSERQFIKMRISKYRELRELSRGSLFK